MKQLQINGTQREWKKWKTERNKLNKDIKKAKKSYLMRSIKDKMENSGTMWRGVKDFLGWENGGAPDILEVQGVLVKAPQEIANEMEETYSKKLEEVEREVGHPSGNFLRTLRNMTRGNCSVFNFEPVGEEDVDRRIRHVPDKQSMGYDDISYGVLKKLRIWITKPLTKIINLSLRIKKYPEEWKIGILKPLFKGGDKRTLDPRSYRPVSLQSSMGRVMEGLLAKQMNRYAEREEILYPGIHGYREGLSPSTAMIEIQSHMLGEIEAGNLVSLSLLDVSAGFDTVSHKYLLRKLETIGYSEDAIEWLNSYLSGRTQMVQIQDSRSKGVSVKKGFPQGGPMSPPLFREYSNDIPYHFFGKHHVEERGE